MGISEGIYGLCFAAFVSLIALMLLRRRISGPGIGIIVACSLSAIWAAGAALPALVDGELSSVLNSLRLSGWLLLMVVLVGMRYGERGQAVPLVLAIGLCAMVVGYDAALLIVDRQSVNPGGRIGEFLHLGFGVAGLLAAENLLRNAGEAGRGRVWPLCLAAGATFAFELFIYADGLLAPGASQLMTAGRGLVGIFAVPLMALAMVRNREWRIDIHVSRTVVLHTAALIASGVFFLVLSAVGVFVRELGGSWGPALQLLTLLGSAIVLAATFASRDVRAHLKHFISRHFFSHRFDYRTEWLRFVDTVSQPGSGADALTTRVVRALAQIVDSPGGTLWCLRDAGVYVPEAAWNLTPERGRTLSFDHPFIMGFRSGTWIQQQGEAASQSWPFDTARAWLAIPLSHGSEIIAFVMLVPPRNAFSLDWESYDLLRAAGRQAASYIAEERSTRALLDYRLLHDYSKRFAFVIHDIKNLASQLGLVVANARRHIDNREFREDMLLTVEDSVARMNRLLAQLHAREPGIAPEFVEPDAVIADLVRELSTVGTRIETRLGARACTAAVSSDQLRSVLSHLIDNAREAGPSEAAIVVSSRTTADKITIEVLDEGPGMDDEFIRDELFRPFRTTKAGGFGIGAYQTRELLRMVGGELEVISTKGFGTIMRVVLPMQQQHLTPSPT